MKFWIILICVWHSGAFAQLKTDAKPVGLHFAEYNDQGSAISSPDITEPGEFEIVYSFSREKGQGGRSFRHQAGVEFGLKILGQEISIQISSPYEIRHSEGSHTRGLGQPELEVKTLLFDDKGWKVAVGSEIEFSHNSAIRKGLSEEGTRVVVPLILSKEYGPLVLIGNVSVAKVIDGDYAHLDTGYGIAAGYALGPKTNVQVGALLENVEEGHVKTLEIGLSHSLNKETTLFLRGSKIISIEGDSYLVLTGVQVQN